MPSGDEQEQVQGSPPDNRVQVDVSKVIASLQRQISEQSMGIAERDALLEMQAESLQTQAEQQERHQSMIDDLSRQVTELQATKKTTVVEHTGRTTRRKAQS